MFSRGSPESDRIRLISSSAGEGDRDRSITCPVVNKVFGNDKVGRFKENGNLTLGRVAINRRTFETRIEWDEGWDEDLVKNAAGQLVLAYKIGIFDRKTIGFGSKVMDLEGKKSGTVREKKFFATVALENNPNLVLDNIPVDKLQRSGNWKKDDKIVYNNEWVGLVVDTRAKVHFTMDKDGKPGRVCVDNYGWVFPHTGEKIHKMSLAYLWDAEWESNFWLWNLIKYLGDPATIQRAEVDCMTIAWMGRIDDDGKEYEYPPNVLRSDSIPKVQYLHGKNWKYIREHDTYEYEVQEGDALITKNEWVRKVTESTFFGLTDRTIDMNGIGQEPIDLNMDGSKLQLEPGSRIFVKAVINRSVVDVDWDDGTFETLPIYSVKPYHAIHIIPVGEEMVAGDLVKDKRESVETSKYGIITKILTNGVMKVKWVTPNPHGRHTIVSAIQDISKFDLDLKKEYLYLRVLNYLPVVVPAKKGQRSVDGVRVGIAVGIDIPQSKVVVRCPDKKERLAWAHDIKHFPGDVIFDPNENKWMSWLKPNEAEVDSSGFEICNPVVLSMNSTGSEVARPRFRHIDIWPADNMFAFEQFEPRSYEAKFQFALDKEFKYLEQDVPEGIWVELYRCRADLLTAVFQGPRNTPYEDFLLLFDFQLMHDFPLSPPDIYFHSYGLDINPCLGVDGRVFIHETEDIKAVERSALVETLLHIRDHILVKEPYYLAKSNWREDHSADYKNFVTMNLLELAESMLKAPPKSWKPFIQKYYSYALPRIIARHQQILIDYKNSRGDDAETATESAFTLGLKSRLEKLRTFLPS